MKRRSMWMLRAVDVPRLGEVETVPIGWKRCGGEILANVRESVIAAENKRVGGGEQKRQMLEERNGCDVAVEAILHVSIKAQPHRVRVERLTDERSAVKAVVAGRVLQTDY